VNCQHAVNIARIARSRQRSIGISVFRSDLSSSGIVVDASRFIRVVSREVVHGLHLASPLMPLPGGEQRSRRVEVRGGAANM
jgi:hypothetical protein